jgi:hypothetical protein
MSIEEKLQNHIVEAYGSVNQFCIKTGIASGTIFGVFSRGINKTSTSTILRVCKNLRIDPNALFEGEIVPEQSPDESSFSTDDLIAWIQNDKLLIEDERLSDQEKRMLIYAIRIMKMDHKNEKR